MLADGGVLPEADAQHDFRYADRGAMVGVKSQDGFRPIGPARAHACSFDPTSLTVRTFALAADEAGRLATQGSTT